MRWSGATGAIARCKNRSIGYVRKPRSAPAWRWTCGEKPKGQGVAKPSTNYMRHGLPKATRSPRYSLQNYPILPGTLFSANLVKIGEGYRCLLVHMYPNGDLLQTPI